MPANPLRGVNIELGFDAAGKPTKRLLKFTNAALSAVQLRFDLAPMDKVITGIAGMYVCCELAACALLHESKDISREELENLLEGEPEKFKPLMTAVVMAWNEAQRRFMPPAAIAAAERRNGGGSGEEKAPPNVPTGGGSTDGPTSTPSSGSPDATESPPA